MSLAEISSPSLLGQLAEIVGPEYVLSDESSCIFYAQDVHHKAEPAAAVVRPGSASELAAAVKASVSAGFAVIPRGGGMSYSKGYVPAEANSIIVDLSRFDRVLEINREDRYVTVECGCTWADLYQALEGSGLRTPYWGTLSGIRATVGGGLAQNSIFWGSGQFGTAVDSVLSIEVVLADGSIVETGAAAQQHGSPFFRHYGPDLTGLFCCDAGALGFKTKATLRLIKQRPERRAAAFDFSEAPALIKAMSEIARSELASECFAFDPNLQSIRMQRESLMSDAKRLAGVMRSSDSVLGALKEGAKVAIAGRGFMKDVAFALNVMVEERFASTADAAIEEIERIATEHGGRSIEPSIPKILRANPFTPLNNVLGPQGERWSPIHALVPHSKAQAIFDQLEAVVERHQSAIDEQQITIGYLYAIVDNHCFVLEPVFFTPDAMTELHRAVVEPNVLKKLPGFESNPTARALTNQLRSEMIEVFAQGGGIHMQIGKTYPYRQQLRSANWHLVERLKHQIDPNCRINPGALGLTPNN